MSVKQFVKRAVDYLLRGLQHRPVKATVVQLAPSELLKGRTALITGGTSGIGYAIAEAFLAAGAQVIITSRDETRVARSCDRLAAGNPALRSRIHGFVMDMTQSSRFAACLETMTRALNGQKLDILVNNAGMLGGGIFEAADDEIKEVLETNLTGPVLLSRLVAKYMIDNRIQGNVLNIASSSSLRPANSAYTLSKWGIRGLTQGMAKTLIPYGIVVNGVAPGPTATPMLKTDASGDIGHDTLPLGRYARPEEIANMAVILTSHLGRTIVGDIVYMTGGAGTITFDDMEYKI